MKDLFKTKTFWAGLLTMLGNVAPIFLDVTPEQIQGFNGVMLAVLAACLRDKLK